MTKPKHINNGNCPKCDEIFDRYAGFDAGLRSWFKALQACVKDAHVACAGRGAEEQETAFKKGTSRAHFGESAHSYNLAIDIFKLHATGAEWPRSWFDAHIAPALTADLEWYGAKGAAFFELPHIQIKNWKAKTDKKLVE